MNDSRVPNRRRVQCEAKNRSKNLKTSERFYQKMGSIIRERRRKKKCVNKFVAVGKQWEKNGWRKWHRGEKKKHEIVTGELVMEMVEEWEVGTAGRGGKSGGV